MKDIYKVHKKDARKIGTIIKEPIVDVTITSPPYFDLKDYGSENQIGFGQEYEDYLDDLKIVFEQVYNVTKDSGTLWVIIDTFRKEGEVVPLPFDFAAKLKEIGWKLQEVIIWGKDRTVPWAHKGQMRSMFEYILVFSKTKEFKFEIDRVRDFQSLKKWWVKYPERYNPKGKTPEAIWNFEIPTQGSWGNGYIRHFCPLPEEMIAQMLKITTDESDIVLDCFSGSGAVLAKAKNMKRQYIGFELNPDYIKMFHEFLQKTAEIKEKEYEKEQLRLLSQSTFEKLILDLRSLKLARLILKGLDENILSEIKNVYVESSSVLPTKKNSLRVVNYYFFIAEKTFDTDSLLNHLQSIVNKAPLSKFGIEALFNFNTDLNEYLEILGKEKLFTYTMKVTHKYKREFELRNLAKKSKTDIIVSRIQLNLDERDYE